MLGTLGILIFIRQTRNVHHEPFDFVGFLTLSLGIGALQLMLDRGELKDWFHSSEIWTEATVAGLGFYLLTVHTVTTDERSFLNRDLLKSANFVAGTLLIFCSGLIMTGTLALLPTMLQNLMNYPTLTTGMVTMPRGIGSMAAMFRVAPLRLAAPPPVAPPPTDDRDRYHQLTGCRLDVCPCCGGIMEPIGPLPRFGQYHWANRYDTS